MGSTLKDIRNLGVALFLAGCAVPKPETPAASSAAPPADTSDSDAAAFFVPVAGRAGDACLFAQTNDGVPISGALTFQRGATSRDGNTVGPGDMIIDFDGTDGKPVLYIVPETGSPRPAQKVAGNAFNNLPPIAQKMVKEGRGLTLLNSALQEMCSRLKPGAIQRGLMTLLKRATPGRDGLHS